MKTLVIALSLGFTALAQTPHYFEAIERGQRYLQDVY